MERWKKIATDLGNRTPVQVQSRVQKYFLKLQKAGLPIPGRAPPARNKSRYLKPPLKKKFYRPSSVLESTKKSSFLSSFVPTVRMDDEVENDIESETDEATKPLYKDRIDNEDERRDTADQSPADAMNSEEIKLLQILNKIKAESEHELRTETYYHAGYKCDHCSCEPVLGSRWQCADCRQDFCNSCLLDSGHDLNHEMTVHR